MIFHMYERNWRFYLSFILIFSKKKVFVVMYCKFCYHLFSSLQLCFLNCHDLHFVFHLQEKAGITVQNATFMASVGLNISFYFVTTKPVWAYNPVLLSIPLTSNDTLDTVLLKDALFIGTKDEKLSMISCKMESKLRWKKVQLIIKPVQDIGKQKNAIIQLHCDDKSNDLADDGQHQVGLANM